MSHLLLVVVGADSASLDAWLAHNRTSLGATVGAVILDNSANQPLSPLANSWLDSRLCSDVFGLIHADVFFDSPLYRMNGETWRPDLEILYETAEAGKVCGIVGADMSPQRYWWGHSLAEEKPVSCLDGCSVFFRKDSGLRFDAETFDGFHCHVEDLCLQAHELNMPVVVPTVKADHAGRSTFDPTWQKDYARYRGKLTEKWAARAPGMGWQTT